MWLHVAASVLGGCVDVNSQVLQAHAWSLLVVVR
jgi:hypothetical protein